MKDEQRFLLAKHIRAARLRLGLTQTELAELLSVSQPHVHGLEGGSRPSADLLINLAKLLGLDVTEYADPGVHRAPAQVGALCTWFHLTSVSALRRLLGDPGPVEVSNVNRVL